MEFFRNLTVNQGIALLAFVVIVVFIAAVAYSISLQEPSGVQPTPTLGFSGLNNSLQIVQPSPTPGQ